PELGNPELHLNSYAGDLGLDDGQPQNVYVLDTDELDVLNSREVEAGGIVLAPGETQQLPDGLGEMEFEAVQDYIAVDITYHPGASAVLFRAHAAAAGRVSPVSLRRRGTWVTAGTTDAGRTLVRYGLLARGDDFGLRDESVALRAPFETTWPV